MPRPAVSICVPLGHPSFLPHVHLVPEFADHGSARLAALCSLQVLSTTVFFFVHVPSTVVGHRDPATHCLRLPIQYWWVGPDSQRREVSDTVALLWDSPSATPPPPWDTARCFWVLGYGHPEQTMALCASSAQPPRADYARPRDLFYSALRLVGYLPRSKYTDLWIRLRHAP